MPKRQRWTPVRGTGNRIYDPVERAALSVLDLPGRLLAPFFKEELGESGPPRRVLVLRLDRIGDVVMSLPALSALRSALPEAHISLAVGTWSAEIARSAPVDDVILWSAPWVGRSKEGAESFLGLFKRARSLRRSPPDLAIDLQGDIRANLLMALTGARVRVGYANTGGAYFLTRVVPLDETVSWVEQNLRAIGVALPGKNVEGRRVDLLEPGENPSELLGRLGLSGRPLVGIHPSAGRTVKEWDPRRWAEVGRRLQGSFGATIVVTGGAGDRALVDALLGNLPGAVDVSGRLRLRETLLLLSALDLFLSSDTGPMHMACALGTPSVSVFGPTDPVRYFSGAPGAPHVVVRHDLWCSPCNLVRKPPAECRVSPECLVLVSEDEVFEKAAELLRVGGRKGPR